MKKYELIAEKSIEYFGVKLFKIRALVSFGVVTKGEEGGYIEKEDNLSQVSGNAWVSGNARVSGDARVYGNAWVSGDARVYGNAHILWFSKVGSELGTLTAFRNSYGDVTITRGCFIGSISDFCKAVTKKHGGTPQEEGYLLIVKYINFHFNNLHPLEK